MSKTAATTTSSTKHQCNNVINRVDQSRESFIQKYALLYTANVSLLSRCWAAGEQIRQCCILYLHSKTRIHKTYISWCVNKPIDSPTIPYSTPYIQPPLYTTNSIKNNSPYRQSVMMYRISRVLIAEQPSSGHMECARSELYQRIKSFKRSC